MSFQYNQHCTINDLSLERNKNFRLIQLNEKEYQVFIDWLVRIVPNNYYDLNEYARSLRRLGTRYGEEQAINIVNKGLLAHIPTAKKIRSGDLGEILASFYVIQNLGFDIPIFKLRFKDHKNMAMRGDDILGMYIDKNLDTIRFLKGEAKSYQSLSTKVMGEAREELDSNRGLPSTHSLQFVADRLQGQKNYDLADPLSFKINQGIQKNDVEHLLFVFTTSPPESLQKTNLDRYQGSITQHYVG